MYHFVGRKRTQSPSVTLDMAPWDLYVSVGSCSTPASANLMYSSSVNALDRDLREVWGGYVSSRAVPLAPIYATHAIWPMLRHSTRRLSSPSFTMPTNNCNSVK